MKKYTLVLGAIFFLNLVNMLYCCPVRYFDSEEPSGGSACEVYEHGFPGCILVLRCANKCVSVKSRKKSLPKKQVVTQKACVVKSKSQKKNILKSKGS